MCQLDQIKQRRTEIYRIAQKHNADKVYVFGSCARQEETPQSDIDFVAEFKDSATLFDHAGLECDLAQIFGRKVDVVAAKALKNDVFAASVRRDMVPL